MSARVVVVAGVVALFSAQRAEACVCASYDHDKDLMTQLRNARDSTPQIFYGRVIEVGAPATPNRATIEVLEVFKGKVDRRVSIEVGDSGDCSFSVEKGAKYLLYGLSVSSCDRSRRVENSNDSELKWLRTWKPIPLPVAVQRENVECTRCDIAALVKELTGASAATKNEDIAAAVAAKQPFWGGGGMNYHDPSWTDFVGIAKDGRTFRLVLTPAYVEQEACRRRLTLTYCESLQPAKRGHRMAQFECSKPGKPIALYDENATRKATTLPVESMSAIIQCSWGSPDEPFCQLDATLHPGAAGTPVLKCSPAFDWIAARDNGYSCRLK